MRVWFHPIKERNRNGLIVNLLQIYPKIKKSRKRKLWRKMQRIENGQEEDYMSLDLAAEMASLDDKMEYEILSHGVM